MSKRSNLEEQINRQLVSIDPNKKIEVSLRDLLFTYQVIGLFVNFFHQPDHYPTLKAVQEFLGDDRAGEYQLLSEVYYQRWYDIWPEDIKRGYAEGMFESPKSPGD